MRGLVSNFCTDNAIDRIPLPEAELWLVRGFVPAELCGGYVSALMNDVAWQQKPIMIYGKSVLQPRLVAWYGDEEAVYKYSGVSNKPLPWLPLLAELRTRICRFADIELNSVLCNLYRDGQDSMGWHADSEPELGEHPNIASLSFGAPRRFLMQHKKNKTAKWECVLENGDLLLMRGTTQAYYRHSVPKTTKQIGPRINLTFRRIYQQ